MNPERGFVKYIIAKKKPASLPAFFIALALDRAP